MIQDVKNAANADLRKNYEGKIYLHNISVKSLEYPNCFFVASLKNAKNY
jgi:hypothetical protein